MGRFNPTDHNLTIAVDDSAVESYVQAAARALSRSGERKVYFRGNADRQYPSLKSSKARGVTVLTPGQEPSNFLESARILHYAGELVIVSSKHLRKGEWREIASSIEAAVRGKRNAV